MILTLIIVISQWNSRVKLFLCYQISQLNPEIVEKQRQEQENKALREEINSLKEMFREFIKTSLKQEQHGNNN